MSSTYGIDEHRHRFAAWAAAAASRRGFTDNASIVTVLDSSALHRHIVSAESWPSTSKEYDRFHRRQARSLIRRFEANGVNAVTYGRVAKIIAIYVKTMVVIGGHHKSPLANVAHPPIDSILLKALAKLSLPTSLRNVCRNTAWTKLDEKPYFELINALRDAGLDDSAFWQLERYWDLANS